MIDINTYEKLAALNEDVRLRAHQERFVNMPGNAAIAAHAVGTGKTLSGIARFERQRNEGGAKKALVVVPAGLRENFATDGIKKFTNSSYNIVGNKAESGRGTYKDVSPDHDYDILSYEMFRRDPEGYVKRSGADTLITDEAHRYKNEGTSTTDSIRDGMRYANNYIGLTGSVISNTIADVQPLYNIANGGHGLLGHNKKEFEKRFLKRDSSKKYEGLADNRKPVIGFNEPRFLAKELSSKIDYIGIDQAKRIANMPDKNVDVEHVEVSDMQARMYKKLLKQDRKLYDMIRKKRYETLRDDEASRAFSSLIEARKLMNSPGSVVPNMSLSNSIENAPKTKRLLDDVATHLKQTPDGQAILLTHLINGGADVLEQGLKDRGVPYGTFLGKGVKGVTEESRQQAVRDYQNRKNRAIIVSSAGGEGLSLGDTTFEAVLDPHYNPEKMNQMEARGVRSNGLSHRPDADRKVQVNRYLATMPRSLGLFKNRLETPDEFIYNIAEKKNKQNQLLFNLLEKEQSRQ